MIIGKVFGINHNQICNFLCYRDLNFQNPYIYEMTKRVYLYKVIQIKSKFSFYHRRTSCETQSIIYRNIEIIFKS